MGLEIERKFLVNATHPELLKLFEKGGTPILQGYLSDDPERVVRVRIYGEQAYLTIKGKQVGISKPEFEYAIPKNDAEALMKLCPRFIQKTRYCLPVSEGLKWEIDVFENLVLAEIELPSEHFKFDLPPWIIQDVSEDYNYSNSVMAQKSNSMKF